MVVPACRLILLFALSVGSISCFLSENSPTKLSDSPASNNADTQEASNTAIKSQYEVLDTNMDNAMIETINYILDVSHSEWPNSDTIRVSYIWNYLQTAYTSYNWHVVETTGGSTAVYNWRDHYIILRRYYDIGGWAWYSIHSTSKC